MISGERRKVGSLERHLQTAIQVVLVALLIWVGNSTVATREAVVTLQAEVAETKQQISQINGRMDKYLLRTEADSRRETIIAQLNAVTLRIDALERGRYGSDTFRGRN